MATIKITRNGNKISVYSEFLNKTFKGEFVNGVLKAKKTLDFKMIAKALQLEALEGSK